MKRLFSFRNTSTISFILSVLAILVIAVSAPGMVQAMLGPGEVPSSQSGSAVQESPYYGPAVNPSANFGSLSDNGTAAYMGIGIATAVSPLHIYSTSSTQPETIDLDGPSPITAQWNNYSNSGGAFSGSGFLARFARNTKASPANVQAGDRLGFNVFGGWAGTGFKHSAAVEAIVGSGTISDTSLPTYMKFSTTPNSSVTRAERMRIGADGRVGIGTTSPDSGSQLHVYNNNASERSIYGQANTSLGTGVYGSGYYGSYGEGTGAGVYGKSTVIAVYAENTGNSNFAYLAGADGVHGETTNGIAVHGIATDGEGVTGESSGSYGVRGNGVAGVYGNGSRWGVEGYSTGGIGVWGQTDNASSYAGYFDGRLYARDNVGLGTKAPNSRLQVMGAIATTITYKDTGGYTLTSNDSVVTVSAGDGPKLIYLPTAVGIAGRTYTIKKIDITGNNVMIDAASVETIDGLLNDNLTAQWKFVTVVSDGANWLVVGKN